MEQAINEITIQVPSDLAAVYHQSSIEDRQQLSEEVSAILRRRLSQPDHSYASLKQTMDRLAGEAQRNGLTEAALEAILQDDETFWDEVTAISGEDFDARPLDPVKLQNALLSAIERNDPQYQAELREALQEATVAGHDRQGMTADEFGKWLANL
jgi:hypothetical protein